MACRSSRCRSRRRCRRHRHLHRDGRAVVGGAGGLAEHLGLGGLLDVINVPVVNEDGVGAPGGGNVELNIGGAEPVEGGGRPGEEFLNGIEVVAEAGDVGGWDGDEVSGEGLGVEAGGQAEGEAEDGPGPDGDGDLAHNS